MGNFCVLSSVEPTRQVRLELLQMGSDSEKPKHCLLFKGSGSEPKQKIHPDGLL